MKLDLRLYTECWGCKARSPHKPTPSLPCKNHRSGMAGRVKGRLAAQRARTFTYWLTLQLIHVPTCCRAEVGPSRSWA
jgi:hypothetical protein